MRRLLWLSCLTVLLAACGDGKRPFLPKSGGLPYEVVVEEDIDSLVYYALDTDVEGLPQREPSFDIFMVNDRNYPAFAQLARNIVRVKIDPRVERPQVRFAKNVDAQPQIRIHVTAPSRKSLREAMPVIGPQLRMLLVRAEQNVEINRLKKHHLAKARKDLMHTFHADMLIPEELTASKKAASFRWYSNNAAQGMSNICLYAYPAQRFSLQEWVAKRDSILRTHIPGETNDMYMTTVKSNLRQDLQREKNGDRWVIRGLWEMTNDMMGGPFVAHAVYDSARATVMVAEAFVYAPESKKRNRIRQLEAALYTLNIQNNGR